MNSRYFKDIGVMDRLITIRQYATRTDNRFGHKTGGTYTDTELYAARSFAGKNEADVSDKETVLSVERYIIRPELENLTVKDEAYLSTVKYDIINIEEIGRQKFLKLTLKRAI